MKRPAPANAAHQDDGVALILALVFLLLFGLAAPALLGFADTSIRAAGTTRAQSDELYAAEAGVQAALESLRADTNLGKDGVPCPDHHTTMNGVPILVRCTPRPGSGSATGGEADPTTAPGQAIVVASPTGAGLVQSSNAELRIGGTIASRAGVSNSASGARLIATRGDILANGPCSGNLQAPSGSVNCNLPTPLVVPDYASPVTSLPAKQTVPACTGTTLTFSPGWYDDAATLSSRTNGGCPGKLLRFLPGTYYFGFANAGSHEWLVSDATVTVIAGTPTAANDNCDTASANGVQFVFGGDSRLNVQSGRMFVCAPAFTNRQRIALYGQRDATGGAATSGARTPATATPTGTTTFAPATDGQVIDGNLAIANLPAAGSATLTLSAFGATVPPGAQITRATLAFAHQEDPQLSGGNFDVNVALRVTAGVAVQNLSITRSKSVLTENYDLTAFVQADPARVPLLAVEYAATTPHNKSGSARVDGATLTVEWTVAGLSAQSGCITKTGYSRADATTCAMFRTDGSNTIVEIHGTIYSPLAALDLGMTNVSRQVVDRGIVARTLHLSITPASTYSGDMIHVPSIAPATALGRQVDLVACVRSGNVCATDASGVDDIRLRVVASFPVATVVTPNPNADVRSWIVTR